MNTIALTQAPIYCRNCKQRNSWVRNPAHDFKGETTGQTLWESWVCSTNGCTNRTIIPVPKAARANLN